MWAPFQNTFFRRIGGWASVLVIAACAPLSSAEHPAERVISYSALYQANGQALLSEISGHPVASAHSLSLKDARFGGWSALAWRPQRDIAAISDNGYWAIFSPPSSATPFLHLGPLLDPQGLPRGRSAERDAEGLIVLPNGGALVSFERETQLVYYAPPHDTQRSAFENAAQPLPLPRGILAAPFNGGPEVLTLLPDGRVLLILEGAPGDLLTSGWIATPLGPWGETPPPLSWQTFSLALSPGMNPTDAVVIPHPIKDKTVGEAVLFIERSFSIPMGFRSRLSVLSLAAIEVAAHDPAAASHGQPLEPTEVARLDLPPVNDNWEGLALDPLAPSQVWLLTDDNYTPLQRTLLISMPVSGLFPSASLGR